MAFSKLKSSIRELEFHVGLISWLTRHPVFRAPPQGLTLQQLQTLKLTSQLERAVMFADRQDVGRLLYSAKNVMSDSCEPEPTLVRIESLRSR